MHTTTQCFFCLHQLLTACLILYYLKPTTSQHHQKSKSHSNSNSSVQTLDGDQSLSFNSDYLALHFKCFLYTRRSVKVSFCGLEIWGDSPFPHPVYYMPPWNYTGMDWQSPRLGRVDYKTSQDCAVNFVKIRIYLQEQRRDPHLNLDLSLLHVIDPGIVNFSPIME